MRGACTPFLGCRLYRPRGTRIQSHSLPLLEREGPVSPFARGACTDPAGRSPSVRSLFRCLSARGLYPFRGCRLYRPCRTLLRLLLSVWGLYPFPRTSSVPTSRDALSVSQPAVAYVRRACTPFQIILKRNKTTVTCSNTRTWQDRNSGRRTRGEVKRWSREPTTRSPRSNRGRLTGQHAYGFLMGRRSVDRRPN